MWCTPARSVLNSQFFRQALSFLTFCQALRRGTVIITCERALPYVLLWHGVRFPRWFPAESSPRALTDSIFKGKKIHLLRRKVPRQLLYYYRPPDYLRRRVRKIDCLNPPPPSPMLLYGDKRASFPTRRQTEFAWRASPCPRGDGFCCENFIKCCFFDISVRIVRGESPERQSAQ